MKKTHKPILDIVVNPLAERGISPMQDKFAKIYATEDGITQTEAARRAGYAEEHAGVTGCQLMKNPRILARIEEIKSEFAKKYEVTFENHVRKLAEIRDMALDVGNFMAAVSAEKNRGQVAGLYIDRKEILVGRMDQMSREEVLKEIQRMQKEYPILAPSDKVLTLEATVIRDVVDTVITEEEDDEEAGTEALG